MNIQFKRILLSHFIFIACFFLPTIIHEAQAQELLTQTTELQKVSTTIKQSKVINSKNKFELSGTAVDTEAVLVVLVKQSVTETNWQIISENDLATSFTGDTITKIKNGKWNAKFEGIPSGKYFVLIYDTAVFDAKGNYIINQKLLAKQLLTVKGPKSLKYKVGSHKKITLGSEQTTSDGGVKITLKDVFYSNGRTGVPQAKLLIEPKGYASSTITVGSYGYSNSYGDSKVKGGGMRIKMIDLSVPRNTATFEVEEVSKG